MPKYVASELWKIHDRLVADGRELVNKVEKAVSAVYRSTIRFDGTLGVDKDGASKIFGRLAASGTVEPAVDEASVEIGGEFGSETRTDFDCHIMVETTITLDRPALKKAPE